MEAAKKVVAVMQAAKKEMDKPKELASRPRRQILIYIIFLATTQLLPLVQFSNDLNENILGGHPTLTSTPIFN